MKKTFVKIFLVVFALTFVSTGCISKKNPDSAQQVKSGDVTYVGRNGSTALDLLKEKYKNKVETKVYSGIGEFVQGIDGRTPDTNHYWAFYVNGKEATVGPSSYISHDTDTLEWKLQEVNRSK